MNVNNIAIVGVGLLGCSLALALKSLKSNIDIVGIDINPQAAIALELSIVDEFYVYDSYNLQNISNIINQLDWLVFAVPVSSFDEILASVAPYINEKCIISDLCSTKVNILSSAYKHLNNQQMANFIALHPIAGSEKHGAAAALEIFNNLQAQTKAKAKSNNKFNLFSNKPLVITPNKYNQSQEIANMQALWSEIGANVVQMDAILHDDIFAAVSHTPHALAYAFMHSIHGYEHKDLAMSLAGSGFADFTRIAGSSHIMWRDIFIQNKEHILKHLTEYTSSLQYMIKSIEQENIADLSDMLQQAALLRNNISNISKL
jgi:prephenate dehydrogenase